ncbi:hypothetical protein FRB93_004454 [Tulasnella sp. JGI-2019a]|nr:hypothetical protein FRB93_004454 [Tulasnella sp. JGI-2019a]
MWKVATVISRPQWVSRLAKHVQHLNGLALDLTVVLDDVFCRRFCDSLATNPTISRHFKTIANIRFVPGRHHGQGASRFVNQRSVARRLLLRGMRIERMEWETMEETVLDASASSRFATRSLAIGAAPLEHLRSLHLIGLRFYVNQASLPVDSPRILPLLEELLFAECDIYALHLLQCLNTPALRTLSFTCSDYPTSDPYAPIMLQPGSVTSLVPSVHHLTLYHIPTFADLAHILSLFPSTTHLALGGRWTLEPFEPESNDFLGQLAAFSIHATPTPINVIRVASIVKSRLATLQTVIMDTSVGDGLDTEQQQDALKWMKENVSLTLLSGEDSIGGSWPLFMTSDPNDSIQLPS